MNLSKRTREVIKNKRKSRNPSPPNPAKSITNHYTFDTFPTQKSNPQTTKLTSPTVVACTPLV